MKLTSENVRNVLEDCFFSEEEDKSKYVEVYAVMRHLGLNPEKVQKNKADIIDMLNQLPDELRAGGGSFLNAVYDKDGNQWGEHDNLDELLCLGLAVDKIKLSPRAFWGLTMGVHLIVFKNL